MTQLPSDVLFDIFSRLPIKSLLRFRCVSPLWCSIIDDPFLAYVHRVRCAEEPKVLLLDHPTNLPGLKFREEGVFLKASLNLVQKFANSKSYVLEGCCDGLLCFTIRFRDDSSLFLFNPARQEVLELQPPCLAPCPPLGRRRYGLGFDSSTKSYKIVGVFFQEGGAENPGSGLSAVVYTLGTGSWRAINKGPPFPLFNRPVWACGALHWLVKPDVTQDDSKHKIVSFDILREEFGLISPPEFQSCHLLDLGGDLAIVDRTSDEQIDIWVMKEYERKEWVKEYTIGLKGVPGNASIEVVGLCEFGELLLKDFFEGFLSYNPKTDELKYSYIPRLNDETQVLCHMASLLSVAKFQSEVAKPIADAGL